MNQGKVTSQNLPGGFFQEQGVKVAGLGKM